MGAAGKKKRGRAISINQQFQDFDKKFEDLKEKLLKQIKQGKKLSDKELLRLIKSITKAAEAEFLIPISIFYNRLSTLEALVTYLVFEKELRFFEIANLLKRNQRTIWGAFNRAKRKKISIEIEESKIKIPLQIFADRTKAPLQVLVQYLKDQFSLKYSEIASLLMLDQRTIWTVYNKKK